VERAKVYVLIHLWYTAVPERCGTEQGAAGGWGQWVWSGKIDDPCRTIPGAPWLREISSGAYPLTGPYDSRNPEILRWQIRQAKAAGIDGFFASVYSWEPHLAYLRDMFFGANSVKGLLQIAQEERFQVAIEGWGIPQPERLAMQAEPWKTEVGRHLAAIAASPYRDAYIHIDGKPAYWLIYPDWMPEQDVVPFFEGTQGSPRSVTWILRAPTVDQAVRLNPQLVRSKLQFPAWTAAPTQSGWAYDPNLVSTLALEGARSDLGMTPTAHIYTGYDERPGKVSQPFYPRYGLRDGVTFITDALENAVTHGARMIFIESWNEWGEGSQIEAGVNIADWRDEGRERTLYRDGTGRDEPYLYLDIFRKFNGMQQWVPPQPPPCSVLDPLMPLRNQQEPKPAWQCQPTG
jgi:hypothetical protein